MVKKEQLDSIRFILVPGAGKYYPNGSRQNYAFLGRVDSSASLWNQYPHMKLILSGYEDDRWYHEAHDLLDALVDKEDCEAYYSCGNAYDICNLLETIDDNID